MPSEHKNLSSDKDKSKVEISQNFVAFSECMNFNAVKVSGRSFTLGLFLRNPLSPVTLQRAIYFLTSNFGFCLNTYFVRLLNIFFWETKIMYSGVHTLKYTHDHK